MQKSILAVSIFLVSAMSACAPEQPNADLATVKRLVARCTEELEAGNYEEARNQSKTIIDSPKLTSQDSGWVDQGRFCFVMANSLAALGRFSVLLSELMPTLHSAGMKKSLNSCICQPFDPLSLVQDPLEENIEQLEIIRSHKGFSWHIDRLPVKIASDELFDANGDYDSGEIEMLYGLNRIFLGGLYLLYSQNYSIAVAPLIEYLLVVDNNPILNFQTAPGKALSNLYAIILATSPVFLTLDDSLGAELMKRSREELSQGFDGLLKAVEFMAGRKGGSTSHLFVLSESMGKNSIQFNFLYAKPTPAQLGLDNIEIRFEGEITQTAFTLREDIIGSGINSDLRRDLLPWLALLKALLVESGVFSALFESAISQTDSENQKAANLLLAEASNLYSWIDSLAAAEGGVDAELDLGAIFENPGDFREALPAWTQPLLSAGTPSTDPAYLTQFRDASLVFSYECANPLGPAAGQVATNFCDYESTITDAAHFHPADGSSVMIWDALAQSATASTTLVWANDISTSNLGPHWNANVPVDPDGIQALTPYIGFKDPTFGGMLFLNIDGIRTPELAGEPKGMRPANLRTLNAALAVEAKW